MGGGGEDLSFDYFFYNDFVSGVCVCVCVCVVLLFVL